MSDVGYQQQVHHLSTVNRHLRVLVDQIAEGALIVETLPVSGQGPQIVFVNRGFITNDKRDPKTRPEGQIVGAVTINGVLRVPQARGMFTPADDVKNGLWFTRDPAGFASAAGLSRGAPFTVDADATAVPGGWPKGGNTVVSFPNNHLQYAITWFLLALSVAGFFLFWARRLLSEERSRAALVTSAPRP